MKNAHDKKKSFIKNKSNMKIYVIFIDTLYYKRWKIMVKKLNYIKLNFNYIKKLHKKLNNYKCEDPKKKAVMMTNKKDLFYLKK